MNILITEPDHYNPDAFELYKQAGKVVELTGDLGSIPNPEEISALVVRLGIKLDQNKLEKLPKLRYIVSPTTGLNHIDLDYCKKVGIDVLSLRGERDFLNTISSTAEHAWALIMALSRSLGRYIESIASGQWDRYAFQQQVLQGKTLGVLGLGRTGMQLAKYAGVFGCEVLAYDPDAEEIPEYVTMMKSVEDLFKLSDIISIHVPLNQDTQGMIDQSLIAKAKHGAMIVNTSRAEVWDELAIADALESGALSGVATDVITREGEEDALISNPLYALDESKFNLIMTPHIAGATPEAMRKTELFMALKFITAIKS